MLERLNLRLDPGDRIGLLGVNGAGKSTFARLLAGDLAPISGKLLHDRRMKVGWFHQHQIEALAADDTPLQIIGRALPGLTEAQSGAGGWRRSASGSTGWRRKSSRSPAASGRAS